MRSRLLPTVVLLMILPVAGQAGPGPVAPLLDFEQGAEGGLPTGWAAFAEGTVFADSLVVHSGRWSARLERDGRSEETWTLMSAATSEARKGSFITLRGYLKTEDVSEFCGLYLRLDGQAGMLGADNMYQRQLKGTHDWAEYTIALPYSAETRKVTFGAVLDGTGKVWVDDLRLLVDGKPFDEAPVLERELTVLDTDTQFDAGSGITAQPLNEEQIANLAVLARVWGFLKYHHPAVTDGGRHWDYDLLRILPRVLEAADRRECVGVLLGLLRDLGEAPPCDPCAELEDDLAGKPRLDWLQDESLLGRNLSRQLQQVHANRHRGGPQFYISQVFNVGNPNFLNEPAYVDDGLPDAGFRLLALFRYWNIIEYWFPSRDIIDRDWNEVLATFIPQVFGAETEDDYKLTMLRLIAQVTDSHANLYAAESLRPPAGSSRVPVVVRFVEGQAVVTGFADAKTPGAAGDLQVGDVIRKVDGAAVSELVKLWEPYYPASNPDRRRHGMARNLTRGAWGPVVLEIERGGRVMTVEARRVNLSRDGLIAGVTHDLPGEEAFRYLGRDVAYLKLSAVELPKTADYLAWADSSRGLIVDIRNYPAAFMVFALGGRLVPQATEFVCFTKGDLDNPGAFVWRPPLSLSPMAPRYGKPVVVLVDETTISQAEYTAMALRAAPQTVVMGSTTAGADGNVSRIMLPGGLQTLISGIGVFYPDRTPTQRVGIVPDIEVRPSIAGIREGRDEVLEAAIRHILGLDAEGEDLRGRYR